MACQSQLEIAGLLKRVQFEAAKLIAEDLKTHFPSSFVVIIHPLLECDWYDYLEEKRRELRGEHWRSDVNVMCFCNGLLLGDEQGLERWAQEHWSFTFTRPSALLLALAEESYSKHLSATGHTFTYMDIAIDGKQIGRLLFELFSDMCPKTCRNFQQLCEGDANVSPSGLVLFYKGSIFHRVLPRGFIQGGDIAPGSRGDGGESIYGPTFEDETFEVSHSKRGILGMANKGPHTNGSQFYITLQPALWMDKKYVAFGQVIEGRDVLQLLENIPTSMERPIVECKIMNCGLFLYGCK